MALFNLSRSQSRLAILGLVFFAFAGSSVVFYKKKITSQSIEDAQVVSLQNIEDLKATAINNLVLENPEKEECLVVKNGDTMISLLMKVGFSKDDAHASIEALKKIHDLKSLKVGQEITVRYKHEGAKPTLLALDYKPSGEQTISLTRNETGELVAKKATVELKKVLKRIQGQISSSFYSSALKKGVPATFVKEAISALSYDINWQSDSKAGDSYDFVFEVYEDPDGNVVKVGALKYASFSPHGTKKQIYRFQPTSGSAGYYNQDGTSVVKALLQTPLDPSKMRITSKFGVRRHPIRGYCKKHQGIDFGAPTGTPIKASGDGVVVKAGFNGNYGNYVLIKHNGEYSTAYAHMKKINVKAGARVTQGQIIGSVGTTGLSTGPHLHYEVIRGGVQINPAGMKLLPTAKLSGKDISLFKQIKADVDRELSKEPPETQVASRQLPLAG